MEEYTSRINVPEDTMLHVVNGIFNKNIKESTCKENILKLIPEIYTEENFEEIIKNNTVRIICNIGKLIEFVKDNDDINEFEIAQFMNLFEKWYNNSSQYVLGGFSPNKLVMKMKR